jgi:hypothetical protein
VGKYYCSARRCRFLDLQPGPDQDSAATPRRPIRKTNDVETNALNRSKRAAPRYNYRRGGRHIKELPACGDEDRRETDCGRLQSRDALPSSRVVVGGTVLADFIEVLLDRGWCRRRMSDMELGHTSWAPRLSAVETREHLYGREVTCSVKRMIGVSELDSDE